MCQMHTQNVTLELNDWHKFLVLKRTILDVGAGCGETAFFYLNHGVERVICVEGNKECLVNLEKNFGKDPRVTIVSAFVENIKVDIDGGEKDMIIETHFPHRLKQLTRLNDSTVFNILEEYWGNPLRKAIRVLARRLA